MIINMDEHVLQRELSIINEISRIDQFIKSLKDNDSVAFSNTIKSLEKIKDQLLRDLDINNNGG